ncbi:MAG: hypothetical protein ACOX2W_15855 [Desulfomonilia bacterium]
MKVKAIGAIDLFNMLIPSMGIKKVKSSATAGVSNAPRQDNKNIQSKGCHFSKYIGVFGIVQAKLDAGNWPFFNRKYQHYQGRSCCWTAL